MAEITYKKVNTRNVEIHLGGKKVGYFYRQQKNGVAKWVIGGPFGDAATIANNGREVALEYNLSEAKKWIRYNHYEIIAKYNEIDIDGKSKFMNVVFPPETHTHYQKRDYEELQAIWNLTLAGDYTWEEASKEFSNHWSRIRFDYTGLPCKTCVKDEDGYCEAECYEGHEVEWSNDFIFWICAQEITDDPRGDFVELIIDSIDSSDLYTDSPVTISSAEIENAGHDARRACKELWLEYNDLRKARKRIDALSPGYIDAFQETQKLKEEINQSLKLHEVPTYKADRCVTIYCVRLVDGSFVFSNRGYAEIFKADFADMEHAKKKIEKFSSIGRTFENNNGLHFTNDGTYFSDRLRISGEICEFVRNNAADIDAVWQESDLTRSS